MSPFLRIALPVLLLCQVSPGFTPFADRFDRFPSSRWETFGGSWSVSDGILSVGGEGGPKALLQGVEAGDFQLDVEVRADAEGAQAGVVFRGSRMEEGVDAFRGYFAGISGGRNTV